MHLCGNLSVFVFTTFHVAHDIGVCVEANHALLMSHLQDGSYECLCEEGFYGEGEGEGKALHGLPGHQDNQVLFDTSRIADCNTCNHSSSACLQMPQPPLTAWMTGDVVKHVMVTTRNV